MRAKFPPNTIEEFCEAVRGKKEWKTGVIELSGWRAWIEAYVDWVGNELWVNVDRGRYYFTLRRLYEDCPNWSWVKQLQEKNWTKSAHIELIEALEKLW